jgi:hypothetical protein
LLINDMMNKRIITALVIAVAITGITSSLSVPVPADAGECGLSAQGEERSSNAKAGQGKDLGQDTAFTAQFNGGLGQATAESASLCRQNP